MNISQRADFQKMAEMLSLMSTSLINRLPHDGYVMTSQMHNFERCPRYNDEAEYSYSHMTRV